MSITPQSFVVVVVVISLNRSNNILGKLTSTANVVQNKYF